MVRKLVLAVAAASALMSSNMVQALGVGEINLRSALNQPLEADIELLQVRDLSSAEIRSVLASPDDFGRAGVDRSFFLTDLTFTPVVQPNGKAYIRVTSTRPVREPYLNFLMEVRWPSGRVLREFTLLLDPPLYDPTPATFSAPIAPPATATGAVRPAATAPAPARPAAATPVARSAPAGTAATEGQRRTTRADTLWGIALETRPQGSSVHQTMLAIQDLNPDAFIGNNINTLKADQTLRLPTADEAAVRSRAEAIAEVGNQNTAWQNRRAAPEPSQRQLDAREQTVAAEAPAQLRGEDSLRIVAGSADGADDTASSSGGGEGSLSEVLDQTKEQLDSAEQARNELTERLADVEGQLDTLQRLLTLKDAQLAALQRELAGEGELPDILPVPEDETLAEAETQLDELARAEPAEQDAPEQPDQAQPQEQTAELDELDELVELDELAQSGAESEEEGQEGSGGDEEQLALAPLVAPEAESGAGPNGGTPPSSPESPTPNSTPVAPQAQPAATQDSSPEALLQRFMQNQTMLLATGAVALLLLLLILMAIARRNARREAELADNELIGEASQAQGPAESENDDFNVALAEVQEEADASLDVALDPLAAAEELVARDELNEAAELLEDAIDQEPERVDLRLKMMEIEARLENQQGYAIQVDALKNMGVAGSSVDLMNARYPLMAAGLVAGSALLDTGAQAEQSSMEDQEQPLLDQPELQEVALDEADSFDTTDFDFADLGLEEEAVASLADAEEQDMGFDLDFDLDDIGTPGVEATEHFAELPADEPALEPSPFDTVAPLDDEAGLGLDDDLQVESLLAEFEAMSASDGGALQMDADVSEDSSLSLSDDDLADFEAQLQAEMQAESGTDAVTQEQDQVGDALVPDNLDTVSEGLMTDGLDDDFDFLSDTDECATKLDLARAYIDMGDEEGARDILAEVVDEGNDQQQQDAREMMEQLG